MKAKTNGKNKRVELGRYIVVDPKICHGQPTFKGSRIMVHQVLEQIAYGTPWEQIVWSWRGKVTMPAITESLQLASKLFKGQISLTPHADHRREHFRSRNLAAA